MSGKLEQLRATVKADDVAGLEAMLADGFDIEERLEGKTVLMHAAAHGAINCIKMLLARNADFAAKNDVGWTASHFAGALGHSKCFEVLERHALNLPY